MMRLPAMPAALSKDYLKIRNLAPAAKALIA
jgi:hypothetical protein